MRAAGRELPAEAGGERGSDGRGEQPREDGGPRSPAGPGPAPAPARARPAVSPREPSRSLRLLADVPQHRGRAAGSALSGQKYVYVEPSRRVKEILAEHLHFQKEECNVKHPAAVALERVWNLKKNFPIRSLKPVSRNRSDLLLQPQFYSRHARMKNR